MILLHYSTRYDEKNMLNIVLNAIFLFFCGAWSLRSRPTKKIKKKHKHISVSGNCKNENTQYDKEKFYNNIFRIIFNK